MNHRLRTAPLDSAVWVEWIFEHSQCFEMKLIWDHRFLFCSVLAHNRRQGCPVHSHCHVLQYANHTDPEVWLLLFTNANTRLASVSNTQQLSSLSVGVSSRTQPHVLLCVCAVLPPLFITSVCVHPLLPLCAVFSLHVLIQAPLYSTKTKCLHQIL